MKSYKKILKYNQFLIKEEYGIKKFLTGYDSSKEKEEAKLQFFKELDEIEKEVKKNPDKYVFDRKFLEEKAKKNKYRGKLRVQRGGRNTSKYYVIYDEGLTGLQKLGSSTRVH